MMYGAVESDDFKLIAAASTTLEEYKRVEERVSARGLNKFLLFAGAMGRAYHSRNHPILAYIAGKTPVRFIQLNWASRISDDLTSVVMDNNSSKLTSIDMANILDRGGDHTKFIGRLAYEQLLKSLQLIDICKPSNFSFVRDVVERVQKDESSHDDIYLTLSYELMRPEVVKVLLRAGHRPGVPTIKGTIARSNFEVARLLVDHYSPFDLDVWSKINTGDIICLLDMKIVPPQDVIIEVFRREMLEVDAEDRMMIVSHIEDPSILFDETVADSLRKTRCLIDLGLTPRQEFIEMASFPIRNYLKIIDHKLTPE